MGSIVAGLNMVLAKFAAALQWIGALFVKVFQALWLLLQDAACWVFESMLSLVVSILSAFDFSGLTAYAGSWAGLPVGVLEVCSAIGLSQAMGIVISAIGIRLMLQLVPFTRLGS